MSDPTNGRPLASRADAAATVPWARQGPSSRTKPVTERVRRLVQGLPDWDPLPPGEILVIRPGRD